MTFQAVVKAGGGCIDGIKCQANVTSLNDLFFRVLQGAGLGRFMVQFQFISFFKPLVAKGNARMGYSTIITS